MIKKLNIIIMVLMSFCLLSCSGESSVIKPGYTISEPSGSNNTTSTTNGTDINVSDVEFTVTLSYNGGTMPIASSEGIYVIWTNRTQEVRALVDNGVAKTKGLDGEFNVHLSKCPSGYTYDPNLEIVSADNPNLSIDFLKINKPKGKGTDLYSNIYKIENITIKDKDNKGEAYAYCAEVKKYVSADQKGTVYYQFQPKSAGIYTIESIVDVNDDNINPFIDIYNGSAAAKFFNETIDDGGYSTKGSYTKNFKYEVKISSEEINNVFAFGIRAKTKNDTYPVKVYFKIVYQDFYQMDITEIELMVAEEVYYKRDSSGKLIYPIDEEGKLINPSDENLAYNYVKIGDTVNGRVINEYHDFTYSCADNGGNLLHGVGQTNALISGKPINNTDKKYLRIRYSKVGDTYIKDPDGEYVRLGTINTPEVTGTYVSFVQYNEFRQSGSGNIVLDGDRFFYNQNDGYYHFDSIDGPIVCAKITAAAVYFESGFIHMEDPGNSALRLFGKYNYKRFIEAEYADMCNSDGVCYLTMELKNFLQGLSNSSSYFFDGNGWCEVDKVFASEENQWLFACGFYN